MSDRYQLRKHNNLIHLNDVSIAASIPYEAAQNVSTSVKIDNAGEYMRVGVYHSFGSDRTTTASRCSAWATKIG